MPHLPKDFPVSKKQAYTLLYQEIYRGVKLDSKTDICQGFAQMGKSDWRWIFERFCSV